MTGRAPFEGVSPGRRRNMQANRSRDTGPEMVLRRMLHALGYRFRLHDKRLPGKPDIVFTRRRKVIEALGCFWHGHGCHPLGKLPSTRSEYWGPKIAATRERDARNAAALADAGWERMEVWECRLRAEPDAIRAELAAFLGPVRATRRIARITPV